MLFARLAHEDPVSCGVEVTHLDELASAPDSVQRGLVDEICQVGPGHSRGAAGDDRQVQVGAHPLVLAVHLQDRQALVEIGQRDDYLAVETARPQQRRVEDVGPVGRGHDDDALGDVETVHFVEHLVEGLLTLIVPATQSSAALAPDGVDLVDEDDRRGLLPRSLEEVTHAARADADEHLHEVRSAHRQEGHAGLAGNPRASSVLPVPGGPTSSTPFGTRAPISLKRPGDLRKSTTSLISCLTP